jgi:hypothetical protein
MSIFSDKVLFYALIYFGTFPKKWWVRCKNDLVTEQPNYVGRAMVVLDQSFILRPDDDLERGHGGQLVEDIRDRLVVVEANIRQWDWTPVGQEQSACKTARPDELLKIAQIEAQYKMYAQLLSWFKVCTLKMCDTSEQFLLCRAVWHTSM